MPRWTPCSYSCGRFPPVLEATSLLGRAPQLLGEIEPGHVERRQDLAQTQKGGVPLASLYAANVRAI